MYATMELTDRPTKQTIQIENICERDLLVEIHFTAPQSGIELQIEEDNPNSEILNCERWIFRFTT